MNINDYGTKNAFIIVMLTGVDIVAHSAPVRLLPTGILFYFYCFLTIAARLGNNLLNSLTTKNLFKL